MRNKKKPVSLQTVLAGKVMPVWIFFLVSPEHKNGKYHKEKKTSVVKHKNESQTSICCKSVL